MILVLDISRWGRYQDSDQAAHYEFLCRQSGCNVLYCGEMFDNDGSFTSVILKNMKRMMASEYSRELSVKVKRAKRHKASLGIIQGKIVTFGLKPVRVSDSGDRLPDSNAAARFPRRRDNITYVPGSKKDVAIVRKIFDMYVRDGASPTTIAEYLEGRKIVREDGLPWHRSNVRCLLASEYYAGTYIFGRSVQPLGGARVPTTSSNWVRAPVQPIISKRLFDQAAVRLASFRPTDEQMLDDLRRLLAVHKQLNYKIIMACPFTKNPSTYLKRFETMKAAYRLVGYYGERRYTWRTSYTDQEMIDALWEIHDKHGFITTRLLESTPGCPGRYCYIVRFDSVSNAYKAMGYDITTRGQAIAAGHRRAKQAAEGALT